MSKKIISLCIISVLVMIGFPIKSNASNLLAVKKISINSSHRMDTLINTEGMPLIPGKEQVKSIQFQNDTAYDYKFEGIVVKNILVTPDANLNEKDKLYVKEHFTEYIQLGIYYEDEEICKTSFKELQTNKAFKNPLNFGPNEKLDIDINLLLEGDVKTLMQNAKVNFDLLLITTYYEQPTEHSSSIRSSKSSKNNRPIITLKGKNVIEVEQNNSYDEPGWVAFDKEDGNITDKVVTEIKQGKIDTSRIGTYNIYYNVTDSKGEKAKTIERIIKVIKKKEKKVLPPVLTLIGERSLTIEKGQEYKDMGCLAYDEIDGEITDAVKYRVLKNGKEIELDTNVLGKYTIEYTVKNSRGIVGNIVLREVTVIDPIKMSEQLPKTGEKMPIKFYFIGTIFIVLSIISLFKRNVIKK